MLDKSLREDHDRIFRPSVIKHINAVATSSLYAILNTVLETDPAQERAYIVDQAFVSPSLLLLKKNLGGKTSRLLFLHRKLELPLLQRDFKHYSKIGF